MIFEGIIALTHRPNVPLQVFCGETTPIQDTGSASVTEGLPFY